MKNPRVHATVLLFVTAMMSAVLLNGCGSANKEAPAGASAGVATIGFTQCYNCHADAKNPASFPTVFGDTAAGASTPLVTGVAGTIQTSGPDFRTAMRGWVNGPHGNYESGTPGAKTDNAPANTGVPAYAYFTDNTCQTCHDPLGGGKTIADFAFSTGVFLIGLENRPVIGCESCHGGGANHWGLGPLPYPAPDAGRCGQCHTKGFPKDGNHITAHPNGSGIFEAYSVSKHAKSVNPTVREVSGNTADVVTPCARCHTDEGARRYLLISSGTMTYDELIDALTGKPAIKNASAVQCRTCHDAHNPFINLGQKALDAGIVPSNGSDKFATCTSCHQIADGYHGEHNPISYPTGSFAASRIIYDTHFYPMSFSGTAASPVVSQVKTYPTYIDLTNSATIAYNSGFVKKADVESCSASCHNPHAADLTINRQWKAGAHGDPLRPAVDHVFSGKTCVRCHLGTGFANLWSTGTASISTWIRSLATDTTIPANFQGQLKTCNACHSGMNFPTSSNKELRKTGTIELVAEGGAFVNFDVNSKPVYTVTVVGMTPDMGNSATCLSCHQGREAGDSVRANIDALASATTTTQANNAKLKFINEHYLAAGATLFGGDGHKAFEYTDGLVSGGNTTNNIPVQTYVGKHPHYNYTRGVACVGCHMQKTGLTDLGGHSFMMKNDAGDINTGICIDCHAGGITNIDTYRLPSNTLDYDGDGVLDGIHGELTGLKNDLIQLLASMVIYYNPDVYPYFHTVGTKASQGSGTGYSNWTQSQLKAAFNLNTFVKEPGAHCHNGKYAAEILIDAIADLSGGPDPSSGTPSYPLPAVSSGDYLFSAATITPQRPVPPFP